MLRKRSVDWTPKGYASVERTLFCEHITQEEKIVNEVCKRAKAHVLEVTPGNFGTGGGSVILWRWYSNLDPRDFEIDFLCSYCPEDRFGKTITSNGGKYYVQQQTGNRVKRKLIHAKQLSAILNTMPRYDCIHIHCEATYQAVPIALLFGHYVNKVIIHAHNTRTDAGRTKRCVHKLLKAFLNMPKIIPLACSDDAAKWFYPQKILNNGNYTVLKNGIDVDSFAFKNDIREAIRENLRVQNKFVIGHVGRFANQKNHGFLIDVFCKIHQKSPEAVLLLIGGDKGEGVLEKIKERVHRLGLEQSVIFYGNTGHVNELYQAMDCFVFPSLFEGLGIVAIEAQAAGLKTLCSDGVPQATKITNLLEYMPLKESPERWAEKILSYNNGYERKDMSEEIKRAGYDIKTSAKQLESIYLSCNTKVESKMGGAIYLKVAFAVEARCAA